MPAPQSSPIVDSFAKLGEINLDEVPDLRRYLSWVPDPRGRCGRWYSLTSLLALCAAAVVAGSVTVEAICEWAADAPAEVLAVHLLSAVDHAAAVTLAQRNVGSKTNASSRACSPGSTWPTPS